MIKHKDTLATSLQQAGLDCETLDNITTVNVILRLCVKSSSIIPSGKDGSNDLRDEQPLLVEDGDLNLIIMMLEDIRLRN